MTPSEGAARSRGNASTPKITTTPAKPTAIRWFQAKAISVADVETAGASALFLAAVRRRDNQFEVVAATAPTIARICAALDGLPLALELAAARTGLLTVEELAQRLDDAVADLGAGPRDAPARQRTLGATIDWSYRLLDRDQQDAFVRLSVFAGGATLDAAQTVTGAVVGTLEALAAKSLIERREQADGTTRLRMLETLRANARERLASHPERHGIHKRHFDYYLGLAEQLTSRLSTHEERHALAVLDRDVDNLGAALQWALDAAPGAALRLVGHLGQYWYIRGNPDALYWLEAALSAAGQDAPAQDRARAQLSRAYQLNTGSERGRWNEANEEALTLYRQLGDNAGLAQAHSSRAFGASKAGDMEGARQYAEAAVRHARIAGDEALLGKTLLTLAMMLPSAEGAPLLDQGGKLLRRVGGYRELAESYLSAGYVSLVEDHVAEALSRLDVALSVLPKVNNPATEMFLLGNLGLAKLFSGALKEARTAFERQLRLCVGQSFRYGADEGLAGLAAVLAAEGRPEQAARLRGAARAMGYPHAGIDDVIADRLEREYFAPVRAACGIAAWRQAEQAGEELSYESAIAFALGQSGPIARRATQMAEQAVSQAEQASATVVRLQRSEAANRQSQRRSRS